MKEFKSSLVIEEYLGGKTFYIENIDVFSETLDNLRQLIAKKLHIQALFIKLRNRPNIKKKDS